MQVHYLPGPLPDFVNTVVTIGTFDGVHIGHRQIISVLQAEAVKCKGESVLITFHPHPRAVLNQFEGKFMLTTLEERINLFEKTGIDHVVVVPFTSDFAMQSAESYVIDFLYRQFKPHTAIIGYDHRFGKNRVGNYKLLESYGEKLGFLVKEIPPEIIRDNTVSSTKIREAVKQGNMSLAQQYLGYTYFIRGKVIMGNQRGRTIGFPTANIQISSLDKLIPHLGVYAVSCSRLNRLGERFKGMMNIGTRPTLDGKYVSIEVHLFEFNEDLYGQELTVFVHEYLRAEQKFDGMQSLQKQLEQDKLAALKILLRHMNN
jgi:riboflavin kinase/FMN adenylyltransferase